MGAPNLFLAWAPSNLVTPLTNMHNVAAQSQLEPCKSSQHLFKYPTNKNHHYYLENLHQIHFNMKFVKSSKLKKFPKHQICYNNKLQVSSLL